MTTLVRPSLFRLCIATACVFTVITTPQAVAATYKWDADGNGNAGTPVNATPGSGTWDTTSVLWNIGAAGTADVAWVNGNTAQFGSSAAVETGPFTITVDSSVTSLGPSSGSSLVFNSSGFTLTANSARSIAVNGGINVSSGVTATIGNHINLTSVTTANAGTGRLILASGSTISSNGTTDFGISNMEIQAGASLTADGRVLVNGLSTQSLLVGGSLSFGGATLFLGQGTSNDMTATLSSGGSITATSATAANGYLQIGSTNGSAVNSGTFNLNGGTLTVAQIREGGSTGTTSAFNFNGGTLKAKTGTSLNATFMQGIDTANVRNGGAVFDTNGQTITVGQALVHSTIIDDNATDGGLTKNGSGTLTLSGVSTYTGATKINTGTLTLASAGSINDSSGVDVASGATFSTAAKTSGYTVNGLAGAGTVTSLAGQSITLATGGILAPGDSGAGTLTFSAGNLAMASGTSFNYQIGGTSLAPTSDLVRFTDATNTVSFTGTQTLLLANIGTVDPTGLTFVLFDAVAPLSIAGTWALDYGTTGWTGGTVGISGDNIVLSGLTLALIPEPSTYAVLAGGLCILVALRRKRV